MIIRSLVRVPMDQSYQTVWVDLWEHSDDQMYERTFDHYYFFWLSVAILAQAILGQNAQALALFFFVGLRYN